MDEYTNYYMILLVFSIANAGFDAYKKDINGFVPWVVVALLSAHLLFEVLI